MKEVWKIIKNLYVSPQYETQVMNFVSYYKNLPPISRICPSDLKNIMFSFKTLHIMKLLNKKHYADDIFTS